MSPERRSLLLEHVENLLLGRNLADRGEERHAAHVRAGDAGGRGRGGNEQVGIGALGGSLADGALRDGVLAAQAVVVEQVLDLGLDAVQRMGYHRANQLERVIFAVARVTGRIVDVSPFHPGVYAGIERGAKELSLKASMTTLDLTTPSTRKDAVAELAQNANAGVILLATEMISDDEYALFEDFDLPLVVLDGWSDKLALDCVTIANEPAAYRATTLLAEKGHERIGYVGSRMRIKNFPQRERGFRHVLEDMCLPFDEKNRILVDPSPEQGYLELCTWLDDNPPLPTAFFCDNDLVAAALIRALNAHGIRVPDDVSVMGFDDEQLCQVIQPTLSSVHVPRHKMGEMAVRRLFEQTTDIRLAPCITMLHTTIVQRQSIKRI